MKIPPNGLLVGIGALTTLFSTMLLWRSPFLLISVLFLTACALLLRKRKIEMVGVYFFGFFFGPITEIASISTGAWHYAEPALFGIPVWLPFVWGCAALVIASAYESLTRHGESEK